MWMRKEIFCRAHSHIRIRSGHLKGLHKKSLSGWKGKQVMSPSPLRSRRVCEAYSDRLSGFRIVLLPAPSRSLEQWQDAGVVPGYSGGTATDLHRLSYF
ncbi:protein of unknown function [Nitrospina watsonii]|uniref:Uncharacterized protein n=1 Tax=Nitrospina watsonii TaxID=1323948 RepID=A0ABM9HEV5_9BACT|nr:protein of unknown function [Nitrospina watsonii]